MSNLLPMNLQSNKEPPLPTLSSTSVVEEKEWAELVQMVTCGVREVLRKGLKDKRRRGYLWFGAGRRALDGIDRF